jgi:hypothetical protein
MNFATTGESNFGSPMISGDFALERRLISYSFGFLAPYLERPCRRAVTPEASSVPRIV